MCMIEDCDERFTVYRSPEQRQSRRDRKCHECGRPIVKGEHYWSAAGLYDGGWDTHDCCEHCRVACQWLEQNCSGFLWHSVLEDIADHVQYYRGRAHCIPRLKRIEIGMERRWRVRRGPRAGQLMPVPALPGTLAPKNAASAAGVESER